MTKVWAVCVIATLIFTASVPYILSGRGDNLIATDETKMKSNMKRLRILMAILSLSTAAFSITVPFMMVYDCTTELLLLTVILAIIVISIVVLAHKWARKK